jgi:hypothetical protein
MTYPIIGLAAITIISLGMVLFLHFHYGCNCGKEQNECICEVPGHDDKDYYKRIAISGWIAILIISLVCLSKTFTDVHHHHALESSMLPKHCALEKVTSLLELERSFIKDFNKDHIICPKQFDGTCPFSSQSNYINENPFFWLETK